MDHFEWKAETTEQGWSRIIHLSFLHSVYSHDLLQIETSESKKDNEELKSKETSQLKQSKDTEESKVSKDTAESKKSKGTERSKKSKGDEKKKPVILKKPEPVTLFLGLEDMKTLSSETVPGLSPCESHFIFVAQTRDIPLDPKDVHCIIYEDYFLHFHI